MEAIHRSDADPYARLAAATIAVAMSDARAGSGKARLWLLTQGVEWLGVIAPELEDEVLKQRLVEALG